MSLRHKFEENKKAIASWSRKQRSAFVCFADVLVIIIIIIIIITWIRQALSTMSISSGPRNTNKQYSKFSYSTWYVEELFRSVGWLDGSIRSPRPYNSHICHVVKKK